MQMIRRHSSFHAVFLLAALLALAGCASPPEKTEEVACLPQPQEEDPRLALADQEISELKDRIDNLQKIVTAQTKQSLEWQLQLAERHSRIQQLQLSLDQAVQEIVRAKARLRSRNSKAETVANLAELKQELKAAESGEVGSKQQAQIDRARHYLDMSENALEKNNYEGSSYLMGQARQALTQLASPKSSKTRSDSAFPVPVPMKTRKLCNLRESANLKSAVLVQLKPGVDVLAIDRKGLWVKIRTPEGKTGWSHFSLLKTAYH